MKKLKRKPGIFIAVLFWLLALSMVYIMITKLKILFGK